MAESEDDEKLPQRAQGPEVIDPHHVETLFVDWLVTGGVYDNVVNVTLGAIDHSLKKVQTDMPQVMVVAKLRFGREFAAFLHAQLGHLLGLPSDGVAPEPPKPPPNSIN